MRESDAVKIALIVGSTRPNRFADVPARWIEQGAAERSDLTLETLDLRDWPLPFLAEPLPPSATGGVYSHPIAERWRQTIGGLTAPPRFVPVGTPVRRRW
jgi:NAD(P)H-dependent FMN reductase